ncbi:hypothetical protein JCM11641_000243 [Rhodosporidiobolus odoratus]
MLPTLALSAFLAVTAVQAAPFFAKKALVKRAEVDKASVEVQEVQIHDSCDAAQTHYLRNGLHEMNIITEHAHDRILRLGEADDLYVRYFGNSSSATTSGFYAQILWGNKPGALLRCDNPDGNCEQTTEAGPWDTNRLHLASFCWDGNKVGVNASSTWLASDLLHRLTHIPAITNRHVVHAADTYADVLALAASNDTLAGFNQATFQLYALDAYARDVAFPPHGCVGTDEEIAAASGDSHGAITTSSASPNSPDVHSTESAATTTGSSAAVAEATAPGQTSATASAAESCHTHSDGEVHCE